MDEPEATVRKSPLCVFALSPPFQPVLAPRRPERPDRRRSLPKVRPRFKRRRSDVPVLHYLRGGGRRDRRQTLDVEDVLNTIRQVWKSPQEPSRLPSPLHLRSTSDRMEGRFRKISHSSSDNSSPVLLRRRLSAPEIIMRKHTLAQQRSDSQDSESTQISDVKSCQFRNEFSLGSDSSLNRKRDSGFMRKSTLLRRLWSNNGKPPTEISAKTSYDLSYRSTQSTKSSPRTSPQHKKMESPKRAQYSSTTMTPKTTTETDTYTETYTTTASLDNSDSAFSNSRSHFTGSSNSEIQKVVVGSTETQKEDENKNPASEDLTAEQAIRNSETQTLSSTNVNVISNVQLSKATLDMIYNQVLRDVQNAAPEGININTLTVTPEPKRIEVQQVPSFYLKTQQEAPSNPKHDQMMKYMISNVGSGSPYSKPADVPQVVVPRFSAYPRTTSMEVNTSSADSTDRESDTISLVDSLEDASSPHTDLSASNRHDDKPVRGSIVSLLPDNSDMKRTRGTSKAFFIPIESDAKVLEKAVSEHLPEKVRERLTRRQMELKSKAASPKSDSNYVSSSENSHRFNIVVGESSGNDGGNKTKQKRRSKPLLPSIQTTRKIRIDSRDESDFSRSRKSTRKQSFSSNSSSKSHTRTRTKLSPLYTTKNEYHYDTVPGRIYHKTEVNNANKRIEILEIMECIDVTPERYSQHSKGKSRIPVLVHPKLPKINQQKPTFLEFQEVRIEDPKIDQLIANILIDTLNKVDDNGDVAEAQHTEKQTKSEDERKPNKYSNGNRFQQKFEVIPEEFLQTSTESNNNNNNDGASKAEDESVKNNNFEKDTREEVKGDPYKGKAALALVKDDNLTTIPQGWITFYMLQKSQGSPESASDEGKPTVENETKKVEEKPVEEKRDAERASDNKENSDSFDRSSCTDVDINANLHRALPQLQPKYRRKTRTRNSSKPAVNQPQPRGWSVTVSGTNTCGDFAPNLEMRLKFPQSNQQNAVTSDSGLGEEQSNKRRTNISRASENICDVSSNENDKSVIDSHRCKLPSINKEKAASRKGKRCESTVITARNEPRQTKTSSRRMSLNRPKHLPLLASTMPLDDIDFNSEERQLEEFLRRFPHFLSVTGNAIYQDNRPRVYAVTESDVVRYTSRH